MTEQQTIKHFTNGVGVATFSAKAAAQELYRNGVRAVLMPQKVYEKFKDHPSVRGWIKEDVDVFRKCVKIEGVEFFCSSRNGWQFGKIVFGEEIKCSL